MSSGSGRTESVGSDSTSADAARRGSAGADSAGQRWAGRELASSPFAGDDGAAELGLAGALERYARGQADLAEVVLALAPARVLVPVLADVELSARGQHGLQVDTQASAGVVALAAPDGRSALPVFSSTQTLAAWRPQARPVPVEAVRAALGAVAERWELLVLDPAGPVTVVVPRPAVWAIAQQTLWRPAVVDGRVDGEILAALASTLDGIAAVAQVSAQPGRQAEVAIVLGMRPGLDRTALDAALQLVRERLSTDAVVAQRVDSLELRLEVAG